MLKNFLVILVALVCGIVLCDALFRAYEHLYLTASYRPNGPEVDLQSFNYNDAKVAKKKPANEFRLLGFGDSFCYAIVKYPFSYHGVARDILAKAFPDRDFRLVNFGEPSSSFYQYLKSMANWTGQVEADAVVVNVFLGNDITDVALGDVPDDTDINRIFGTNFVDVQTGRKRLSAVPHKFWLRMLDYAYALAVAWREGYYVLRDIPEPYTFALGPLGEEDFFRTMRRQALAGQPDSCQKLARGWQALADLARGLSQIGRERGLRVAIMLSPGEIMVDPALWRKTAARYGLDPDSFDPERPDRLARRILAKVAPDVPVLDLTPAFRCAAARGQREYYPSETHWNVDGNRLAGQALARFVAGNWLNGTSPTPADGDTCLDAPDAAPKSDPDANDSCLSAIVK
jgi:hypothetical protein